MLRIFVGFDDRQWVSFTTLASSLYKTAKLPVAITPLILETLPIFGGFQRVKEQSDTRVWSIEFFESIVAFKIRGVRPGRILQDVP